MSHPSKHVQEEQNEDDFVSDYSESYTEQELRFESQLSQASRTRESSVAPSGYDAGSEYSTPTSCLSRTGSPTSCQVTIPKLNICTPLIAPVPKHFLSAFLADRTASPDAPSGAETPVTAPTPEFRYPSEHPLPTPPPELHHPRPIKTFSCEGYNDRDIPTPVFIPSSRPATDDDS